MDFAFDWLKTYSRSEPIDFSSHVWFTSDDLKKFIKFVIDFKSNYYHWMI